jgi:leucyl/phenylalanyl-tRNA--protein transferase
MDGLESEELSLIESTQRKLFWEASSDIQFPDPAKAPASSPAAVGGNLSIPVLLAAYRSGFFPWYNEDEPLQWWTPDPRMVVFPDKIKVHKDVLRLIRKNRWTFRINHDFNQVVDHCANQYRPGQSGTWIHPEMKEAYRKLHQAGLAYSFETYQDELLTGGLYGVHLGRVFFGESMFHLQNGASKAAFYAACHALSKSDCQIIDCQVYTDHLAFLGGTMIPRSSFGRYLSMISFGSLPNPSFFQARKMDWAF